ncbi:MAG: M36 family metallopeptidase [Bryobacterales bacterium]
MKAVQCATRWMRSADRRPSLRRGLTEPSSADAEVIARRFLSSTDGVSPYTATQLRLRQRSQSGALEILRFQQYAGNVPVYEAAARVAVDSSGRVRLATFDSPAPGLRLAQSFPRLSAEQAIAAVLASFGVEAPESFEQLDPAGPRMLFAHPTSGMPIGAELVAFPLPNGQGILAWRIFTDAGNGSYEVLASADDGRTLLRRNVASEIGSGRVFPVNPLQPSEVLQFGEGWLAPESTVTSGNNIDAYVDRDGDDEPDPGPTEGLDGGRASSPSQMFDFDPGTGDDAGFRYQPASVVNAFYHSNLAHDFFYDLGFGEAEGNFQVDNGDRGGLGDDPVRVEVQDIAVINNARFIPRPDGMASRMELGLEFSSNSGIRDFAYEAPVVVHEYTHGVTLRSVGGPDVVSCLGSVQPGALGEGWSDYFGASFYNAPIFGDYVSGDHGNGIRGKAIDKNSRTYADLGDPRFQVHADGTIWASLLWDIRTALGAKPRISDLPRAFGHRMQSHLRGCSRRDSRRRRRRARDDFVDNLRHPRPGLCRFGLQLQLRRQNGFQRQFRSAAQLESGQPLSAGDLSAFRAGDVRTTVFVHGA